MKSITYTYLAIAFSVLIVAGCSTTEKTTRTSPSDETDNTVEQAEKTTDLQILLNNNRSSLSDTYLNQKQDMPEVFSNENVLNLDKNTDPFNGYRIQILSVRKVSEADSVAASFRKWSQQKIQGYQPRAYVSFKQPYYKVKVGDFHDRTKANQFSKMLKIKYSGAWVVHDRIKPSSIPADTTDIRINNKSDD